MKKLNEKKNENYDFVLKQKTDKKLLKDKILYSNFFDLKSALKRGPVLKTLKQYKKKTKLINN